LFVIVGFQKPV